MNKNKIDLIVGSTLAVASIVGYVYLHKKLRTNHQARIAEIDHNSQLDLAAMERASATMHKKIDAGEIHNLAELAAAFNTEIEFEKIAIREA